MLWCLCGVASFGCTHSRFDVYPLNHLCGEAGEGGCLCGTVRASNGAPVPSAHISVYLAEETRVLFGLDLDEFSAEDVSRWKAARSDVGGVHSRTSSFGEFCVALKKGHRYLVQVEKKDFRVAMTLVGPGATGADVQLVPE